MTQYFKKITVSFLMITYPLQCAVDGEINSIVLQTDSKIVAAGSNNLASKFQTARYNTDGSLDTTFGFNGSVTTLIGSNSQATSAAVQADGNIVVAGLATVSDVQIALVRYDSSGALDATFGVNGIVTTSIGDGATANALAIQPDGALVIAGAAVIGGTPQIVLVRYDATGALDTTFGTGGIVTTLIDFVSAAYAMALQSDGKIVVAGLSQNGSGINFTVARYDATGALDTATFGSGNGYVTTTITGSDIATSVAIQSDGSIVASGYSSSPSTITLARYTSAGVLDSGFGTGGIVTTSHENGSFGFGVVVQTDSAIAVTGSTLSFSGSELFTTVRYLTNGTIDTSFGTSGTVITSIGENAGARAIIQQADAKLVAAGYSQFNDIAYFTLVRYVSDGSLDQSFGVGGIAGPFERAKCCTGSTGATGNTGPQGITGNTGPEQVAANYLFAYDTTTQTVAVADSFQNVNFSTNQLLNNWAHTGGTSIFTCPADGVYLIQYRLLGDNSSVTDSASTISARVLVNDVEIPGSQSAITLGALVGQLLPVHQSLLVTCSANDQIVLQFTGTTTNNQITPNTGSGTTRPSATITISKL